MKKMALIETFFTEVSQGRKELSEMTNMEKFMVWHAARSLKIDTNEFIASLSGASSEYIQKLAEQTPIGAFISQRGQMIIAFYETSQKNWYETMHILLLEAPPEVLKALESIEPPVNLPPVEAFLLVGGFLKDESVTIKNQSQWLRFKNYIYEVTVLLTNEFPNLSSLLKEELIELFKVSSDDAEEARAINDIGGLQDWFKFKKEAEEQNVNLVYKPGRGFRTKPASGRARYFPEAKTFLENFHLYLNTLKEKIELKKLDRILTEDHTAFTRGQTGFVLKWGKRGIWGLWKPPKVAKVWTLQEIDALIKDNGYRRQIQPNLDIAILGLEGTVLKVGTLGCVGTWLKSQVAKDDSKIGEVPPELVALAHFT